MVRMPTRRVESEMERTTITIPEKQLQRVDQQVTNGEFHSRSDVIRTAIREYFEHHPAQTPEAESCPAA